MTRFAISDDCLLLEAREAAARMDEYDSMFWHAQRKRDGSDDRSLEIAAAKAGVMHGLDLAERMLEPRGPFERPAGEPSFIVGVLGIALFLFVAAGFVVAATPVCP